MVKTLPCLTPLETFKEALTNLIRNSPTYIRVKIPLSQHQTLEVFFYEDKLALRTYEWLGEGKPPENLPETFFLKIIKTDKKPAKTKIIIETANKAWGNVEEQVNTVKEFFTKLLGENYKPIIKKRKDRSKYANVQTQKLIINYLPEI